MTSPDQNEPPLSPKSNTNGGFMSPAAYAITGFMGVLTAAYFLYRDSPILFGHALAEIESAAPILGGTCLLLYLGIFLYVVRRQRLFLSAHNVIDGPHALDELKTVARINMQMVYPLIASGLIAIIYGLVMIREFGLRGYLFMAFLVASNLFVTNQTRKAEAAIRGLAATSEALEHAHQDIVTRWKKDLWPTF